MPVAAFQPGTDPISDPSQGLGPAGLTAGLKIRQAGCGVAESANESLAVVAEIKGAVCEFDQSDNSNGKLLSKGPENQKLTMGTFLTETTIENKLEVDNSSQESILPTPQMGPTPQTSATEVEAGSLTTTSFHTSVASTPRPPPSRTPRLDTKRSFNARSLRSSSGLASNITKSTDPESEREKRAAEMMSEWLSSMPPTMPFHRGQVIGVHF